MRKSVLLTLCFLLILTGISAAQEGEPIKIGAIFDLTGATAEVGTPYADGVIAYVDWLNSSGGINGRPIELLSAGYAYQVPNAESLYAQFVEEGVVAFIGWGTGDTEALRGRIAEDEIPFMSASYSDALNDPNGEAPYNFLVGTTYSDQLVILQQYMLDQWTAAGNDPAEMHVVVFHNDSPFGTSPLADGQAAAEAAGIGSFNAIPMPRGATDFTAELSTAETEYGVTHIIVQNTSGPAATLLNNLAETGLLEFVEFGCLNWCADEILVNLSGEAAEGALGALPFGPTTVEVEGQADPIAYLEANGGTLEAATLHFTQGWWTIAAMAEGIRRTLDAGEELTGPNIRAHLETLEGFETGGITEPITFTADDHRGNRALPVYQVEGGQWVAVGDAIDLRASE